MQRIGSALVNHFSTQEFKLPDAMDPYYLLFLDAVRGEAGMEFKLYSDARTPEHNAAIGGVPTSLHLFDPVKQSFKARAVDFGISEFERHIEPWASFAKIGEAVFKVWHEKIIPYGYELEFQYGKENKHIHLGLFREQGHECHLITKADQDILP